MEPYTSSVDMHEPADPVPHRRVQQYLGAPHVGADERRRLVDGPVDVGLRGEVNHGVVPAHHIVDQVLVTDVAEDEAQARIALDRSEVGHDAE